MGVYNKSFFLIGINKIRNLLFDHWDKSSNSNRHIHNLDCHFCLNYRTELTITQGEINYPKSLFDISKMAFNEDCSSGS